MKVRFYFIFIIFVLTAILIFTVYLRNADNQIFYKLYSLSNEQNRLKQQLWQKQLRLEGMINPAAVSQYISELEQGNGNTDILAGNDSQ